MNGKYTAAARRIWVCGMAWAVAAAALGEDTVIMTSGSPVGGAITSMTYQTVTVNTRAGERRIPVNEIKKISFDEDTGEIRSVRDQALAGQVEDALRTLNNEVKADAITRDLIRSDMEFYRAYCLIKVALMGGGDINAARDAMSGFISRNATSYHLFHAAELLGDVEMARNQFGEAAKWYGNYSKAPWPEYQLKGKVLTADSYVRLGDFAKAVASYDEVIGNPLNTGDAVRQKTLAQVGKAYCLAQGGQPDEGIQIVLKIINENDPQDAALFGRAYNALGACHLKANRPKDALFAYLHTKLMFYGDADVHAEALYHLAKLWEQQQQAERALDCRSTLKESYGGTAWASKP